MEREKERGGGGRREEGRFEIDSYVIYKPCKSWSENLKDGRSEMRCRIRR